MAIVNVSQASSNSTYPISQYRATNLIFFYEHRSFLQVIMLNPSPPLSMSWKEQSKLLKTITQFVEGVSDLSI